MNHIRTGTLNPAKRPGARAPAGPPRLTAIRAAACTTAADLLAEDRVRNADDGRVGDRRVFVEDGLDLHAVDVLASSDEHVLGPVHDVDETLVVQTSYVTVCSQPSVKVAAVASALLQYPLTMLGPEIHNSPTSPTGTVGTVGVDDLHLTTGTGGPTLSGLAR